MRQRPTSQRPTSLGAYAYEDSEWGVRDDGRSFVEARKVLRPEDSTKKASAAKEEEAGSGGEPTTEFERAFGRQEDADGDENNDRLRKLAEDAEWGTFREKVEHLGDLVWPLMTLIALSFQQCDVGRRDRAHRKARMSLRD
jgi:hypothetical protein